MRTFGKYRLVEPLASGGMADVWRAEWTLAEGVIKEVALKLVRGEHAARSDFVRMFVDEARLASRLGHANVVQVLDFDQVDGRYYIAMELVRGHHLGQVVERCREAGARFGLARAVRVGAEVAKALDYAHRLTDGARALGVVHRDVSPHNVLVSYEGEVKLADFGIARALGQAGLTAPGTLKGKLAYMAPEQARGEPVDARADVFALGVVLWELCAGRRLFARDSEAATLAAVLDGPAPSPPSAWNEEVPPELDAVVLRALERDAARRTPSAAELGDALAAILLRLTRTPEEADLRALMQRLWPPGTRGAPALEATRVRAVPMAAEPVAGEPVAGETRVAPAPGATVALEGEGTATRTAPSPRRGRAALAWAAAALAALVAAGVTVAARSARTAPIVATPPASAAPAPAPPPAAAPAAAPRAETAPPAAEAPPAAPPREPVEQTSPLPRPLEVRANLSLDPPDASTGEGVLSVNAMPWGSVTLNGASLGETPLSVKLPAGRYRLRVDHRGGALRKTVTITAGRRTAITAR